MRASGPPEWMLTLLFIAMGTHWLLYTVVMITCWRHGYGIDPWRFRNFADLKEIIGRHTDLALKRRYRYLLYGTYLTLASSILAFVAICVRVHFGI